jgi:hypothetical protein
MVIPALGSQFLHKILDHSLPPILSGSCVSGFDVRHVTS